MQLHKRCGTMDWKEHCPIDEEEWPVKRQAWHAGWKYRVEHGDQDFADAGPTTHDVMKEHGHAALSIWLQGYSAADNLMD